MAMHLQSAATGWQHLQVLGSRRLFWYSILLGGCLLVASVVCFRDSVAETAITEEGLRWMFLWASCLLSASLAVLMVELLAPQIEVHFFQALMAMPSSWGLYKFWLWCVSLYFTFQPLWHWSDLRLGPDDQMTKAADVTERVISVLALFTTVTMVLVIIAKIVVAVLYTRKHSHKVLTALQQESILADLAACIAPIKKKDLKAMEAEEARAEEEAARNAQDDRDIVPPLPPTRSPYTHLPTQGSCGQGLPRAGSMRNQSNGGERPSARQLKNSVSRLTDGLTVTQDSPAAGAFGLGLPRQYSSHSVSSTVLKPMNSGVALRSQGGAQLPSFKQRNLMRSSKDDASIANAVAAAVAAAPTTSPSVMPSALVPTTSPEALTGLEDAARRQSKSLDGTASTGPVNVSPGKRVSWNPVFAASRKAPAMGVGGRSEAAAAAAVAAVTAMNGMTDGVMSPGAVGSPYAVISHSLVGTAASSAAQSLNGAATAVTTSPSKVVLTLGQADSSPGIAPAPATALEAGGKADVTNATPFGLAASQRLAAQQINADGTFASFRMAPSLAQQNNTLGLDGIVPEKLTIDVTPSPDSFNSKQSGMLALGQPQATPKHGHAASVRCWHSIKRLPTCVRQWWARVCNCAVQEWKQLRRLQALVSMQDISTVHIRRTLVQALYLQYKLRNTSPAQSCSMEAGAAAVLRAMHASKEAGGVWLDPEATKEASKLAVRAVQSAPQLGQHPDGGHDGGPGSPTWPEQHQMRPPPWLKLTSPRRLLDELLQAYGTLMDGDLMAMAATYAKLVFASVCPANPNYITRRDLLDMDIHQDGVEMVWELFDKDHDDMITPDDVRATAVSFYQQRRNLALTVRAMRNLTLSIMVTVVLVVNGVFLMVVYLAILDVTSVFASGSTTKTSLDFFSAYILVISLIFGEAIRNVLGGALLLLAQQPFDIGEEIIVEEQPGWRYMGIIQDFNLMYVSIKKSTDGELVTIPINKITSGKFTNLTRSDWKVEQNYFAVDMNTPRSVLQRLTDAALIHIRANPNEYDVEYGFAAFFHGMERPNKVIIRTFHRYRFNLSAPHKRIAKARDGIMDVLVRVFLELGVSFVELRQLVAPLPDPYAAQAPGVLPNNSPYSTELYAALQPAASQQVGLASSPRYTTGASPRYSTQLAPSRASSANPASLSLVSPRPSATQGGAAMPAGRGQAGAGVMAHTQPGEMNLSLLLSSSSQPGFASPTPSPATDSLPIGAPTALLQSTAVLDAATHAATTTVPMGTGVTTGQQQQSTSATAGQQRLAARPPLPPTAGSATSAGTQTSSTAAGAAGVRAGARTSGFTSRLGPSAVTTSRAIPISNPAAHSTIPEDAILSTSAPAAYAHVSATAPSMVLSMSPREDSFAGFSRSAGDPQAPALGVPVSASLMSIPTSTAPFPMSMPVMAPQPTSFSSHSSSFPTEAEHVVAGFAALGMLSAQADEDGGAD